MYARQVYDTTKRIVLGPVISDHLSAAEALFTTIERLLDLETRLETSYRVYGVA